MIPRSGHTAGKGMTMRLFDENKPFFKGNLHTHTTNSDGHVSPEEAISLYQQHGYDFLSITDHRKRTTGLMNHKGMLVLPGTEIDFALPGQTIHLVGIQVSEEVEQFDRAQGPQACINLFRRMGGLAILAHPVWSFNDTNTICALKNLSAVEIYNTASQPPWNPDRADATSLLDFAANKGCLLPTVASDDTHRYTGDQCRAATMVQADELSTEAIISAIHQGNCYATLGPTFNQVSYDGDIVTVTCSPVSRVFFHTNLPWAPLRSVQGEGITTAQYKVQHDMGDSYVRVIIEDEKGLRAWANPFKV